MVNEEPKRRTSATPGKRGFGLTGSWRSRYAREKGKIKKNQLLREGYQVGWERKSLEQNCGVQWGTGKIVEKKLRQLLIVK